MASRFAGWPCMTTWLWGSIFSLAAWLIMWAGNSEVNLPPSAKPQRSCAVSPPFVSRTRSRFTSGATCTFLKYLPVPVTRKNLPSSAVQEKPVGISRRTVPSAESAASHPAAGSHCRRCARPSRGRTYSLPCGSSPPSTAPSEYPS